MFSDGVEIRPWSAQLTALDIAVSCRDTLINCMSIAYFHDSCLLSTFDGDNRVGRPAPLNTLVVVTSLNLGKYYNLTAENLERLIANKT